MTGLTVVNKMIDIVDPVLSFFYQLPGWVAVAVLGALGCFVLVMFFLNISMGLKRAKQWKEIASILGFHYRSPDVKLPGAFRCLESFNNIMSRGENRLLNVLNGAHGSEQIWLIDHFTGKPMKTRSACIMRIPDLKAPHFRLWRKWRPGSMIRSIAPKVTFPEDPAFSRKFWLNGEDSDAIRQLFDADVRKHIKELYHRCCELEKANSKWHTQVMFYTIGRFELEASGDTISIHLSRFIYPEGAKDFIALTSETLGYFRRRQALSIR